MEHQAWSLSAAAGPAPNSPYWITCGTMAGTGLGEFVRRELRAEWFPAAAVRTIAETGAPTWLVETFERLLAANGGRLGGFFDVFAWRHRYVDARFGPARECLLRSPGALTLTGSAEALSCRMSRCRQQGGQGALTGPPARGGCLRNRSLTQRPGAVRAIHSGLLMTVRSREVRRGSRTAAARAARPPWRTTGIWAVEALRRTCRITYRLTGSPARRITGEKMMISGHRAREMTAWVVGLGRLIWPG